MENASKALLIAGAILLSILIISLGLMAYQGAKNTVGSSNLSKQEIESFNSQWESYQGSNKTASEVRSLYSAVIAHNAAEAKLGTGREITIKGLTETGTAEANATEPTGMPSSSAIPNSKTYIITPKYQDGLIRSFAITIPATDAPSGGNG